MKIVITGASGFLGQYIQNGMKGAGEIVTIGRSNQAIKCDLSVDVPEIADCSMVIHAAGKAHSVPRNLQEERDFFSVNVTGTQNLLKGLQSTTGLKQFVFISSASVYGLTEGFLVKESYPLLAKDPYGLSKIQGEEMVQEWCKKNGIKCTILRLPLLVGCNPPGNLGTMIKGIQKGYYFNIAGGTARKSMVMAADVAEFILAASEIGGVFNVTDGYHPSFYELSLKIANQMGKPKVPNLPLPVAKAFAAIGDVLSGFPINSKSLNKIVSSLTFDDTKARNIFDWRPTSVLDNFKI